MSEPKFTPGPWRVDETKSLGAYGVWTEYAHPNNPGHDGAGYAVQICSVTDGQWYKADAIVGREERNANARLIAASPTMYSYIARKSQEGDRDAAKIIAAIHGGRVD